MVIDARSAGQRLDNCLLRELKGVPKSRVYRMIRKGEVRVNGRRARSETRLETGDNVRIPPVVADAAEQAPVLGADFANLLRSAVLEERQGYLVVNKPAGLAVHGGSGHAAGLIESLRVLLPKYPFLELVHRLDKDTSGLLLVATKPAVLKALQALFRGRDIEKKYLLAVRGRWPAGLARVNAPLLADKRAAGEARVRTHKDGKPALTLFRVCQPGLRVSLVQAQLMTGRTHQIRVHCSFAGHPIIGDPRYGDPVINRQCQAAGFRRMYLHAWQLAFEDPVSHQPVRFEAKPDADFDALIQRQP
jgi:23S rRNA pseudouridine955/2504/2580 synthase